MRPPTPRFFWVLREALKLRGTKYGAAGEHKGYDVLGVKGALEAVIECSGGGKRKLPAGIAMGIAFHYSFQGYFAYAAGVTVDPRTD